MGAGPVPSQLRTRDPVTFDQSARRPQAGIAAWFGVAVVAGLWLLARPYLGVRHDGVLYMGQTLLRLQPDVFSHDIFFAYGSQDEFSVFSRIVSHLYSWLGLGTTELIILPLSIAALLAAVASLLRTLPDARDRWLGLAALSVMSHHYGGYGVFSFAESFVTARTVAEPLSVMALAAMLAGRPAWAVALVAAAGAVHPLMALPSAIIIWLVLALRDPRWYLGLAALPALVGLAFAGVPPFSGLLHSYDAVWGGAVLEANLHVFVARWQLVDWQALALDFGLLAIYARLLPPVLAQMCRLALVAVAALMAVSLIGADLFHNILITQLQLWRGLWLTHLLAMIFLPWLFRSLWRRGPVGRHFALAAAAAVLAITMTWATGWAFAIWALLLAALMQRRVALSPSVDRLVWVANVLSLVGLTLAIGWRTQGELVQADAVVDRSLLAWLLASMPTVAMPLAGWLLASFDQGRARAAFATGMALVLLATGASTWDRRSAWTRYIENATPGKHPFSRLMAKDAQVYWPDQLAATWAVLGRSSYGSVSQRSGLLFNRATAIEYLRRQPSLAGFGLQRELCKLIATVRSDGPESDTCAPDPELLQDICRFPKGPDFLVFPYKLRLGLVSEWTFSAPDATPLTYFLYDCLKLR